jgi:DNA-binding NarL/FixJ family response regulator
MKAFIYCQDALLLERCRDLFGGRNTVTQLHDIEGINRQKAASGDVLIVDLKACDEKELTYLSIPTVALTAVPAFDQAVRLLQRGVRGYGNRHMHPENLRQAVTAVREGQVWLPPAIVTRMITAIPANGNGNGRPKPNSHEKLSKREDEVVQLVGSGLSNKEIADKLFISVRTVKAHLTSIFAKTGHRDRLELAVKMRHH